MRIKNKRILVTGGAGSVGSELIRQLVKGNKIFILDINETGTFDLREELKQKGYWVHSRTGDIRDEGTVFDVFSDFKPHIVFHVAALKHVTPCEEYPREAFETNVMGTLNVVEQAKKWEGLQKFVFISTDKVVNAVSIMGISKLAAESIVRRSGKNFVAVRFGNVLGSRGSVSEIWQRQFDNNEPLTFTHPEMERYMMTIQESCNLVIEAAEKGENGELWVLNMGKRIKILDLMHKIIELSGDKKDIVNIGVRPGEMLKERLMTAEERERAVKRGKFWVVK